MRNCVKIEIFLRNLLHKWEMAIFLAQGVAVYKAKKLGTQDDAFGKIGALPPSSLSVSSLVQNCQLFTLRKLRKKQWDLGVKVKRTRKILMQ